MEQIYDAAVIGGGPGGYSAAIQAARLGGKVIVFEKENSMGGTCLNAGCIPTKCLLEKADLIEKIRKNTENGIFKEAGLFSWKKIQENKNSVVKRLTTGVESILKSYDIEIIKCKAVLKEPGVIETEGKGERYAAKKIIIATGSKASIPPVEGIDGRNVIDSTEALSLKKIPSSMAIIGAGVVGLEFACIYSALGTSVSVIEMLPELLPNEDKETVKALRGELEKKKIKFITNAKVKRISDLENAKVIGYLKEGCSHSIEAEVVLAAGGRVANLEGIDAGRLGLELDRKGNIKVNGRLETNIEGIYAVGDVIGGYQLAHSAYAEAEAAGRNCLGGSLEAKLDIMPRCIYSIPQLAAVGITEETAIEKGIRYGKGIFPYIGNGKALASDAKFGFVKAISEKETGRLLGVHIVGAYATELIASALTAINMGAAVDDFCHMIFPHPTLSEMIKESVLSADNKAVHLPRK